jgi:hypothetical protein
MQKIFQRKQFKDGKQINIRNHHQMSHKVTNLKQKRMENYFSKIEML